METLSFGAVLVGIAWILIWFIQNDRRPPDQPKIGFFAMPDTQDQKSHIDTTDPRRDRK